MNARDDSTMRLQRATRAIRIQAGTLPPLDELRFLLANGESKGTIADRYGVAEAAVSRAFEREAQQAREAA